MKILGISAFYHDSAVALIDNGEIVFAAHEERFSRLKHDPGFPNETLKYLIEKFQISIEDLDYIVFYEKPFIKFERLLETYLNYAPLKGFKSFSKSLPVWAKEKLFQKNEIIENLLQLFKNSNSLIIEKKLLFSEHHLSHAASAFYPSPFKKSAILTIDGVGEWTTTSIGIGDGNKINTVEEIHYPHSLGLLYSAFTYFLGFKVNSGEYKVMGLAPYGSPKFKDKILDNLIRLNKDGSYFLNQDYFNYSVGLTMTNNKFSSLFGILRRNEDEPLEQIHMDLAASIQSVLEKAVLNLAYRAKQITSCENLCMAGGVALNCVANYKLFKNNVFDKIWVQPASGDAGGALGAALNVNYNILENERILNENIMKNCFLGSKYSETDIEEVLKKYEIIYTKLSREDLNSKVAKEISNNKIVGWFNGKSEYGPRALGSRSIIADPRPKEMQRKLNLKIKYRESFRPFAPAVLEEDSDEWFSSEVKNEYMLFINKVKDANLTNGGTIEGLDKLKYIDSKISSVTHVDLTARVQVVKEKTNNDFYNLIKEFKKITGIPILINTSFNVRGEPIVNTPEDAIKAFLGTEIDILVLNNFFVIKSDQHDYLFTKKYASTFGKD